MITARKPSEQLFDSLNAAFSKEVSGEHNTVAFAQWMGSLGTTLTEKSSFDPDTYLSVSAGFSSDAIKDRKNNLLSLCNYLYRVALSLDLLEKLESENEDFERKNDSKARNYENEVARQHARTSGRIDFTTLQGNLNSFKETYSADFKTEIKAICAKQLSAIVKKNEEEQTAIENEILAFERALSTSNNIELLERQKQSLLQTIATHKLALKNDLEIKREVKAEFPRIIPSLQQEKSFDTYEKELANLQQQIVRLQDELKNDEQKKSTVNLLPAITEKSKLNNDLNIIAEANLLDLANKQQEFENIKTTISSQYGIASKIGIYGYRQTKQKWDELQATATQLHQKWCDDEAKSLHGFAPISIQQRIKLIREKRQKLLQDQVNVEKARVENVKTQLKLLQAEADALTHSHQNFCAAINQTQQKEMRDIQKLNQPTLKSVDQTYDALAQKVNAINVKKQIEKQQKEKLLLPSREQKEEAREPLLPSAPAEIKSVARRPVRTLQLKPITIQPVKKPSKIHRFFAGLGTVAMLGCAATLWFLSGPPGWIAGGACALAGLVSWGISGYKYKKYRAETRRIQQLENSNHSPSITRTNPRGKNLADIQMSLRTNTSVLQNIKKLGLDPDAAQGGPKGELQFQLRNGLHLSFLAQGNVRLYSKDHKRFNEFAALTELTPNLNKLIPNEYRLRR